MRTSSNRSTSSADPRPRHGIDLSTRGTAIVAGALAAALALAGCTAGGTGPGASSTGTAASAEPTPDDLVVLAKPRPGIHRIDGSAVALAIGASRAFFTRAPAVVVLGDGADTAAARAAANRAAELGVPLLEAPAATKGKGGLEAELSRLGTRTLIGYGSLSDGIAGDRDTVDGSDESAELPHLEAPTARKGFAAVARTGHTDDAGTRAAVATARAAGAALHTMSTADPREAKNLGFFRDQADAALYAIGDGFAKDTDFTALAETAAGGTELPGGGQIVFPQRRMVALYGTPGTSALGLLGEQGVDASIKRAKKLAADYQPYSREKVQPAFEIIATVASSSAGKDGTYSSYAPVSQLEPWVKAAHQAGVYVVLDLQPGRNDFPTQAKHYEKLLAYPNVGLAYDPEWRLGPGQRHMAQIGSVSAAELNRTNDWLAALTRKHRLPQKVVILHQFQLGMIRDRSKLDTSHPELAMVLHADGNGSRGQKMATWNALRRDLPQGIRLAWKNFIDEDSPTFTPRETFDVHPKPWFVSYQ